MQVRMPTLTLIAMVVLHGLVYEYNWDILRVPIIAIKYTLLLIIRNPSYHRISADVSDELLNVKTVNMLRKHSTTPH